MRSVLFTTLAGLLAIFVVASPNPASATPAATLLKYSPQTATEVVPVHRRYRRRYYRGRPYYRPYRYSRRPYYRPYRYYGRPYRYRYPYYGRRYYRPRVGVYVGI
ncbi:MAG: hypothetical protein AAF967_02880 [Pseudomonadota bacterium]